jgi:hypothetical protein
MPRLKRSQRHVVRNIIGAGVAVVILSFGLIAPVAAGPFEEAVAAYKRGDYATAMQLWRPLADQGNTIAQNYLGVMYAQGRGVPQDFAVAVSWYRKAADQGYAVAQYNLGAMYAIVPDYVSAHMWFNLAAAAGYKNAASNRDVVAAGMTQAQIAEAQRLADVWRPSRTRENPAQVVAIPEPRLEPQPSFPPAARGTLIPLQLYGGAFTVPVSINDTLTLNFVLDSGAADVSIPADVVSTLMRTGTLGAGDKTYRSLSNLSYQIIETR